MEYDRINLALKKGQKAEIKAHADAMGKSVNGFIARAISETMEREAPDRELAELRLAIGQLDLETLLIGIRKCVLCGANIIDRANILWYDKIKILL